MNITELNDQLSAEEFELLLRQRIERELSRLGKRVSFLTLWTHTAYGSISEITRCYWELGSVGETKTEGEILHAVIDEQNRRQDFEATCKLRVLEHQTEETSKLPEPVSVEKDEIPY